MHKNRFCNFSEDIHGLIPEKKIVCNVENNWELRAQNTFSSPGNYRLSIMDKKTWGDLFASFEMPVSLFPFLSVSLMLSTQGILKNEKKKSSSHLSACCQKYCLVVDGFFTNWLIQELVAFS